jgi:hypothetical protein
MPSLAHWTRVIAEACAEPDPARCNERITRVHYGLSEALANAIGRDAGPNFHSWAVWGSCKAGYTIRQEDMRSAVRNAMLIAGACGLLVGIASGLLAGRWMQWHNDLAAATLGAALGAFTGAVSGRLIAVWSRRKASRLVLAGNRTVLEDIGTQSARFLDLLEAGATPADRAAFFAGLRPGPSETHGQARLGIAFRAYLDAVDAPDLHARRAAMIAANCEIVYHEHIRLDPYIRGAMPLIIRRCATRRAMQYQIGDDRLTVYEDVPGSASPTAARNWAHIEERMRYVFALFRRYHEAPGVFAAPFSE